MATLAAQIETNLGVMVTTATLNKLTGSDAPRLTLVCEIAADEVESYLGDTDGDDTKAVQLGVQIALYNLGSTFPMTATDKSEAHLDRIYSRLERLAESRRQEDDIGTATPDFSNLDKRYNIESWDDPDD